MILISPLSRNILTGSPDDSTSSESDEEGEASCNQDNFMDAKQVKESGIL